MSLPLLRLSQKCPSGQVFLLLRTGEIAVTSRVFVWGTHPIVRPNLLRFARCPEPSPVIRLYYPMSLWTTVHLQHRLARIYRMCPMCVPCRLCVFVPSQCPSVACPCLCVSRRGFPSGHCPFLCPTLRSMMHTPVMRVSRSIYADFVVKDLSHPQGRPAL
jgi:hypothetical protein